jgi:hypothetical protein
LILFRKPYEYVHAGQDRGCDLGIEPIDDSVIGEGGHGAFVRLGG